MLTPIFASLIALSTASGWSCQNQDLEISCADGSCEVADGFTPMDVTVDQHSLNVCAYSGCWSGPATTVSSGNALYAVGHGMTWSQDASASGATFQVALDTSTGIAVLNGEAYAHPMLCQPLDDASKTR